MRLVDNHAIMLTKIKTSGLFAVSVLSDDQLDISMHFAGQERKQQKINFEELSSVPVIKNALASFVCKLDQSMETGDHTMFIGKVMDVRVTEGKPLTFFEGKYEKHLIHR